MRILIVEDEPVSAKTLAELMYKILNNSIATLHIEKNLDSLKSYLETTTIDLLLLDLTLAAEDGFKFLRSIAQKPFSTIIISDSTEHAIEAFKYDVLDFLPKPLDEEKLTIALHRFAAQTTKQPNK